MDIGDLVFIKKGTKALVGVGIVKSDYKFSDESIIEGSDYNHIRDIDWIKTDEITVPKRMGQLVQKTLTNITNIDYKSWKGSTYYEELAKIMDFDINSYMG